jgi:hypothetical protein
VENFVNTFIGGINSLISKVNAISGLIGLPAIKLLDYYQYTPLAMPEQKPVDMSKATAESSTAPNYFVSASGSYKEAYGAPTGGGDTYNITVEGSILSDRELLDLIDEYLIRQKRDRS